MRDFIGWALTVSLFISTVVVFILLWNQQITHAKIDRVWAECLGEVAE